MSRRPKTKKRPEHGDLHRRNETVSGAARQGDASRAAPRRDPISPAPRPRTHGPYTAPAVCGFLLLAVVLVFRQTLGHGFVNFDDNHYVYENARLTSGLTTEAIAWAFATTDANNWHPLTWLSYLLDFEFYGLKPWGYHLTNVLSHAAAAILLFLVLRQMTADLWPSAFAAAVFAVHPLHVESVAWVAERKDVLSGLFFMLTLAAYVGYARRPFSLLRYLAVVVLFVLGLMAKPMLVTLPFVLLLLDYWPLKRMAKGPCHGETPPHFNGGALGSGKRSSNVALGWRLVAEKLPLMVLSAASCVATQLAQGTAVQSMDKFPLVSRIENALVSYVAYVGKFFYPLGLAVFYPYPGSGFPIWKVAGAVLILAGVTAGAVVYWRRCPSLLVGWLWYLGMLVPVIGLVQVGEQAMADRYTYLPQIGLAIALAWGAKRVLDRWPSRAWLGGVASALLLAALMGCSWQQTSYWRDSETLWAHTLDCTSRNTLAEINLGVLLYAQGHVDDAARHFQNALDIEPDDAMTRNNLGIALYDKGHVADAITQYRKALEVDPLYAEAHNNLGNALLAEKEIDEATAEYREALKIRPDYVDAGYNLGLLLHRQGKLPEAIAQWGELVRLRPDSTVVLDRMAWVLATSPQASVRNGPRAIELAQRAAKLTGGQHPAILDTLAAAYAEAGRLPEALRTAEQALALASSQNKTALAEALQERIKLYRAGSPYRDALPPVNIPSVQP